MIYHLKKTLLSSLAMFHIQLTANSLQLSMKKAVPHQGHRSFHHYLMFCCGIEASLV